MRVFVLSYLFLRILSSIIFTFQVEAELPYSTVSYLYYPFFMFCEDCFMSLC